MVTERQRNVNRTDGMSKGMTTPRVVEQPLLQYMKLVSDADALHIFKLPKDIATSQAALQEALAEYGTMATTWEQQAQCAEDDVFLVVTGSIKTIMGCAIMTEKERPSVVIAMELRHSDFATCVDDRGRRHR